LLIGVPCSRPVSSVTENGKEAGVSLTSEAGVELLIDAFLLLLSWLLLSVTLMKRRRTREKETWMMMVASGTLSLVCGAEVHDNAIVGFPEVLCHREMR
jgi:hypothetical protein